MGCSINRQVSQDPAQKQVVINPATQEKNVKNPSGEDKEQQFGFKIRTVILKETSTKQDLDKLSNGDFLKMLKRSAQVKNKYVSI